MSTHLIMVITSQRIHVSNHYIVPLKLPQLWPIVTQWSQEGGHLGPVRTPLHGVWPFLSEDDAVFFRVGSSLRLESFTLKSGIGMRSLFPQTVAASTPERMSQMSLESKVASSSFLSPAVGTLVLFIIYRLSGCCINPASVRSDLGISNGES